MHKYIEKYIGKFRVIDFKVLFVWLFTIRQLSRKVNYYMNSRNVGCFKEKHKVPK